MHLGKFWIVAAAATAAALVGGCGGGDSDVKLSPQLEAALKYLPQDSAIVVVVPTNIDSGPLKQLDDLGSANVDGWSRLRKQLQDELSADGNRQEVEALLGNPLAISQSGPATDNQTLAIQVQDPAAIKKGAEGDIAGGDAKALPEYNGAYLWQDTKPEDVEDDDDADFNALKGNILVGARTEQLVKQALDNAGGSDNAGSNNDFKQKLADMGDNSLLRLVGDAQQILDNVKDKEDVANARKVKFVSALGLFYGNATVGTDQISSETIVETNNEDLSEDDLPFTTQNASLTLPSTDPAVGAGLAEPDRLFAFTLATIKQVSPEAAQIDQATSQFKSATGLDLSKDLIGQMQQVSVAYTGGDQYEFRVQLVDGAQFGQALEKTQTFLQTPLANEDLAVSLKGSGENTTYVIERRGREVARFAIKGNVLVGSVGPVGDLPSPTAGGTIEGSGALAAEAELSKIEQLVPKDQIDDEDDQLALDIVTSLGPATQVLSETTDQITIKGNVRVGK